MRPAAKSLILNASDLPADGFQDPRRARQGGRSGRAARGRPGPQAQRGDAPPAVSPVPAWASQYVTGPRPEAERVTDLSPVLHILNARDSHAYYVDLYAMSVNVVEYWRYRSLQDAAAPGQGVLIQFSRSLRLAEFTQVHSQIAGRAECVRMIFSQHSAESGEGVFI